MCSKFQNKFTKQVFVKWEDKNMFKVNKKDTGTTYKFAQLKSKTADRPFSNNNQL